MRKSPIPLLALLALLMAVSAKAQTPTVLKPGQPVTVAWDAPDSDSPANAPTGYRFETFRETETGVVITTTDVPLSPTTATLPASALPAPEDGPFLLAVRAFNDAGVSDRSNALSFLRPAVPPVPGNLRVVPAP